MNTTLHVRHFDKSAEIEKHFAEQADRIMHHLEHCRPEAIFVHGNVDKNPHKDQFSVSVTIYAPAMSLHARETSSDVLKAINAACAVLIRQIERSKAKLRRSRRTARKSKGK